MEESTDGLSIDKSTISTRNKR